MSCPSTALTQRTQMPHFKSGQCSGGKMWKTRHLLDRERSVVRPIGKGKTSVEFRGRRTQLSDVEVHGGVVRAKKLRPRPRIIGSQNALECARSTHPRKTQRDTVRADAVRSKVCQERKFVERVANAILPSSSHFDAHRMARS